MALLSNFLKGIADAIRLKKETAESISASNFASEISLLPTSKYENEIISGTITKYDVPNGVIKLKPYLFYLTPLEQITFNEELEEIGDACFNGTKLTTINIDKGVTKLGNSLLSNCTNLKEVYIGDAVNQIGTGLLSGCMYLEKVSLPKSFTNNNAFNGNFKNCDTYYRGTLNDWLNLIFPSSESSPTKLTGTLKNLYILENNEFVQPKNIVIPDNVEELKDYTFYYWRSIETINLNKVKSLGRQVFAYCKNLKEINLSDLITDIPWGAFDYCGSVERIYIGKYVTNINMYAFRGMNNNCHVFINATTPPTLASLNFQEVSKIFVPKGTKLAYTSATNWSSLASKIFEPNEKVTLNVNSSLLNNGNYLYSFDHGTTWNQFESSTMELEYITELKFKNLATSPVIKIGTTSGGSEIGTIANAELNYTTSANEVIYVGV